MLPPEWEFGEETADGPGPVGSAADGLQPRPAGVPGLLLIGDAAGAVNPFNGEGIAYAMETGEIAAELVHEALVHGPAGPSRCVPAGAAGHLRAATSSIGRQFARIIGNPAGDGPGHPVPAAQARWSWRFALRVMAQPHRRPRRRLPRTGFSDARAAPGARR